MKAEKFVLTKRDAMHHHTYTMKAFEHINAIVNAMEQINGFADLKVMQLVEVLYQEFCKLVYTNPAYYEAFDVLLRINPKKFKRYMLREYHPNLVVD